MSRVAPAIILSLALCVGSTAYAEPPNIVLILADDLGYGDVQALNPASRIPTPNLNRLASQGATFTDAHAPSSVCTPTRYGILTGRYAWRTRLTSGVLDGYDKPLIAPARETIAGFLSGAGYHTGIVGKWHLGLSFQPSNEPGAIDFTRPVGDHPNTRGFDFSFIIPASLDFPPYVYIRNGQVTDPDVVTQPRQEFPPFLREGPRSPDLVMEDCLDRLLEEATAYIRRQAGEAEPFFLYFPLTAPHKPTLPHQRFRGRTELGPYADFVVQVDWTVGEVMKTLDESGLTDNTLLLFTSDNGSYMYPRDEGPDHADDETIQAYRPEHHTPHHQFRGTKGDIWEAGHRVPFFARWPGHVTPGRTVDATICQTDIFATAAELVDKDIPEGTAQDSYTFASLLTGADDDSERIPVIHHSGRGMFAIRQGPWKLVLGDGSGGREPPRGTPFEKPYQLFNLASDPSETSNVIDGHPDVAQRLEAAFHGIRGTASTE